MSDFKSALEEKVWQSRFNNYGLENYDEYRFKDAPIISRNSTGALNSIKREIGNSVFFRRKSLNNRLRLLKDYEYGLQRIWENLDAEGRELLVSLTAFRSLGHTKIKLERNNKNYWKAIEVAKTLKNPNDVYDPHFMHFVLEKFDLSPIGYDIKLYFSDIGIAIDYIIEQYAHQSAGKRNVYAGEGDVVLDVGACWGDTALYFASCVGETGKVYSFEFIPDNIKLFDINVSLNPRLLKRIELIQHPVSDIFGNTIYFKDNGPGSKVKPESFKDQTGSATTITIDDFVAKSKLSKVDFIKMDIEGAESAALQGAIETIKKHRPKLAIAIYHSMKDFVNIPNWILDLNLGYELFIGHYTIHSEETVCFAKTDRLT
jgi:FkbM family methyltransferase